MSDTGAAPPTDPVAADQAVLDEIGARHGLWAPGTAGATLARGGENTTVAVEGWVVRFNEDHDAVAREAALLGALARATSVSTPVPQVHDDRLGLLIYRRLPGEPLLARQQRPAAGAVAALTEVLAALRQIPEAQRLPVDDYPNDAWHQDALEHFRATSSRLEPERAAVIAFFLSEPVPPNRDLLVPQHNDLGAEHILVDRTGVVTGVIDWTDAARTDPARDLGRLYRDLGSEIAFGVAAALDGPVGDDERTRIQFHARCTWLEDFRYAVDDPGPRALYLDNCLRTFDHTFGNPA
ncbi:aminoglycoside phosphotransferase family protein [Pseudactinotalea terrae]|uniref:aminoglycoside phosphotransferase family protein n=1 Tax=Pseudactinotalea terrae TaxID=1743262 RepID=UPI001391432B|nr:aminoglycoside phosphotransferase family protein [Pseudactinotalea terrae]